MPRDGSNIYSAPAGTNGTPATPISSSAYNAFVADVVADLNLARPIVAGGTGATTAGAALANLGGLASTTSLAALGPLTPAADRLPYFTGASAAALATFTAFGRSLVDDADAAAARTTLGLGALATRADITTAQVAAATLVTASEGISSNNNDTTLPTSAAVKAYVDTNAPNPIKAWVNFNGVPQTGTYSRSGNTVTVTITGHGMSTGMVANLDFTSGTATDGSYTVTVTNANTFTVQDPASGATSGNVTMNNYIRASLNVTSITDSGVGRYTVNITSAISDARYAALSTAGDAAENRLAAQTTDMTTTTFKIYVINHGNGIFTDADFVSATVIR